MTAVTVPRWRWDCASHTRHLLPVEALACPRDSVTARCGALVRVGVFPWVCVPTCERCEALGAQ